MAYDSLRYVDSVWSDNSDRWNFLFRGGEPLTTDPVTGQQVFDYAGLTAAIANPVNPPSVPLPPPSEYFLVVINLEHPNENVNLNAGINFFADPANQALGQLHLWDTNGTAQCYFQQPPEVREQMVATLDEWLPDPLIWRVATIHNWLSNESLLPASQPAGQNLPIVIYVHCDGGCDRTSEMIGAYRLRYMPRTWTEADAWINMYNEHPCSKPMGCNNYMATQWYAFWLNQVKGQSLRGIGEDGGCNNAGTVQNLCSP
jgi:hypothetical protein